MSCTFSDIKIHKMVTVMKYIIPEYFKSFKCKCGSCKHCCCEGWPVRISMKEYYRLLGINCSKKLRAKLDCALRNCSEPDTVCYAEISTDWNGVCMLRREDGLCSLQKELGENTLPEICRLYPRRLVQLSDTNLCSCANSCEEIIELLFALQSPMQFEESDLSMNPKFEVKGPKHQFENCKYAISILQDRTRSLPERLITLGNFLSGYEWCTKDTKDLFLAYQFLYSLDKIYEDNRSVSDYCRSAEHYFCIDRKDTLTKEDLMMISEKHGLALRYLDIHLPEWQEIMEQLLVNHMFYSTFPYTEDLDTADDAYLSLVIIYSFLRINLLGFMCKQINRNLLINFFAAMFRLIEHSSFDYVAVKLLKGMNYSVQELVNQLLHI